MDMSEGGAAGHRFELSFGPKLLLSMCGLVLLTGAAILLVADRSSRASTRILVDSLFREVSGHAVSQTRDFIQRAAPVAESLAQLADHGLALDDPERLAPQLLAFLKGNPGLTRVLYADESGDRISAARLDEGHLRIERSRIAGGKTRLTEHDVQPDATWTLAREDDQSDYDPRHRPFYVLAKEQGTLAWTPPYLFFSRPIPGISCVIPVKTASGALRGVFSVEFDLNALSQFVSALAVSEHSRVFVFTPDQTLLAHPNQRGLAGAKGGAMLTLADTGDPLVDAFRLHLEPGHLTGTSGRAFHLFEFDHGGTGYLASTTVFPISEGQSWVVGAVAPQSDFLAAVWRARLLSLGVALGALGLAAVWAAGTARRISVPVRELIAFMKRVGAGDLDSKAEFHGGREFRDLAAALNRMIADLRDRLQLRHSLQVAMEVQKSLLPAGDPASPRFDVAGRSRYCDQTGGDYYDFIEVAPVSPSVLLIAVGDVMGHGVPAALVMATVRAALRTSALDGHRLADLMNRTNRVLAVDNRHNRFVTLSLLLIDADRRAVRWASAGHDPPIVYDPAADGARELEGGDVPLGISAGTEYQDYTADPLSPGSVVIIGTDGVWEMQDERQQQYGKERLRRVVREHHAEPAAAIAAALEADLAKFRGAQAPADDVTFVIVKFRS
jgi:serine phosphatase RsbU (regulator of sigma subunit)